MQPFIIVALLALVTSGAAYAAPLRIADFTSVELHGAGEITLKSGPVQRVTVDEDSVGISTFRVDHRGRLIIQSCVRNCSRSYKLRVTITRPTFAALTVDGGGIMRASKGFPRHGNLALSVSGGGTLDVRDLTGNHVSASVSRGGAIATSASTHLAATITDGGSIRYSGDPEVTSAVLGGGNVTRD